MQITSMIELQAMVAESQTIALNKTMERLLAELKTIILEEVYAYRLTGSWDNRTRQFLESWNNIAPTVVGNLVQATINQADYNWTYQTGQDLWSHASSVGDGDNASLININLLDTVINEGLNVSNFGFPAINKRPYWDKFHEYVELNLTRIWIEECAKVKLNMVSVNGVFSR